MREPDSVWSNRRRRRPRLRMQANVRRGQVRRGGHSVQVRLIDRLHNLCIFLVLVSINVSLRSEFFFIYLYSNIRLPPREIFFLVRRET